MPESGVVAARPLDSRDTVEGEDTASHNGADDVASDRSSLLFLKPLALLVLQHQQLCVGRQHFANRVLKLPPRSDSAPYLFDPILGDVLDTFFPLNHKGQRPDGMAPIIGTMAGGLAATEMGEGERTGEGIRGNRKTAKQLELALAQTRSERALAWMDHLIVYIQ